MAVATMKDPKRNRAANKVFRRQQLIDATIDCISKSGVAETTLAKVAERANLSQGIVIFHFKSKDQLFIEALRYIAEEYSQAWHRALDRVGDDAATIEKVCALVNADFDISLSTRKKIAVWFAFWGEAKSHPTYQSICGARVQARGELMVRLCMELCDANKGPAMGGENAASCIDNLSDGYWQKMYLDKTFSRKDALKIMYELLLEFFPSYKDVIVRHQDKIN